LKYSKYLFLCLAVLTSSQVIAQHDTSSVVKNYPTPVIDSAKQRDAIDFLLKIIKKDTSIKSRLHAKKLVFSVVPALGLSLTTGFVADITANMAFYTSADHANNLSAVDLETVYDTKNQKIFASRSEVWYDQNKYKLITDVRWEAYPIDTYGLGSATTNATVDPLDYNYLRLYGTFFKKIKDDFYAGLGYDLDHHYNITQSGIVNNQVSDYTKYGFHPSSTSSGLVLNLLFDNRRNSINPLNGGCASVIYRDNLTFLGSDSHWQELSMDFRRYFRVSQNNYNVIALWGISAFTKGNVPYLDLPYTASDTYNNSGRGYPEQRFRGKDELYLEGEFRFGILKNGLLGGVMFVNGESFTGLNGGFQKIAPATGTGVRIKINKHSDTNVCIDYAYGLNSRGIFVNLGEDF